MSDEINNPSPTTSGGLTVQAFDEEEVLKTIWNSCVLKARELNVDPQLIVDAVMDAVRSIVEEKPSPSDSPKGLGVQPDIKTKLETQAAAAKFDYRPGVIPQGYHEHEVHYMDGFLDGGRWVIEQTGDLALNITDESLSKVSSPEPKTKDADLGPHEGWCDTQNKISDVCNCLASSYIDQIDRWKERHQKLSSSPSDFQVIEHLTERCERYEKGLENMRLRKCMCIDSKSFAQCQSCDEFDELLAPKKEGT